MFKHGKVRSTVRPEPLIVDEFSVWISSNVIAVKEEAAENETVDFDGWEYDLVQYEKDEYIRIMAEKTADLQNQLTDTQLALCEIYEGMV